MASALILLGFDITHAVLTLTNYKPSRAIVVLALVDHRLDPRTSTAYSSLSQVANAMGIEIKRLEVEVTSINEAVTTIRRALEELVESPPVIIDMGGGMRLLVIETLFAYLSLSKDVRKHVRLVLYLEGTNRSIEMGFEDVEFILSRPRLVLSDIENAVLSVMEVGREYGLEDVYRRVQERGLTVSKQYVHKVLKKLVAKGLVIHSGRGRYIRRVEDVFGS